MIKVAIIIGSTRPGRNGEAVGKWVYEIASKRTDATYELIDLLEVNLPLLDEPNSPAMQKYTKQHTKDWSARIDPFDAFVFVTPEYNHGVPAALKNALDFLYKEWNNKAAGFVAYGNAGGARSVEHLRATMAELQMADVREQVALSLFTDFENYSVFKPASFHEKKLNTLLDQLVSWGTALKQVREKGKQDNSDQ
ncbi:NADPH-dependent FMN reductase [Pontibacter indicus]|uniref:NAD(P)H-dependent FMN reductase n=1 Tax=Pontibacter indicus TaxID=1317125 RepID=A0A1R3WX05_9BACT|nr:NAD(P)H-dependent oxidoreductase [Pontibacter indicus]SIT83080.1 NAD(P)H-dependent FMN reductase [Pontibacter indicus]